MVEFALIAPILFVLVFGVVVVGIVVMNQVQLTNAVRDGARAAAICGGPNRVTGSTLPNGSGCTSDNLLSYIESRLQAVPGGATAAVCVYDVAGNCCPDPAVPACPLIVTNILDQCSSGDTIEVRVDYFQSLYLPLVGRVFGTPGAPANTRILSSSAEAVCEQ